MGEPDEVITITVRRWGGRYGACIERQASGIGAESGPYWTSLGGILTWCWRMLTDSQGKPPAVGDVK